MLCAILNRQYDQNLTNIVKQESTRGQADEILKFLFQKVFWYLVFLLPSTTLLLVFTVQLRYESRKDLWCKLSLCFCCITWNFVWWIAGQLTCWPRRPCWTYSELHYYWQFQTFKVKSFTSLTVACMCYDLSSWNNQKNKDVVFLFPWKPLSMHGATVHAFWQRRKGNV